MLNYDTFYLQTFYTTKISTFTDHMQNINVERQKYKSERKNNMKTSRFMSAAFALILASASMTGCGSKTEKSVSTDGSTSMEKVIGYLSEAYMADNSDVKVTYNPTGSGAGIQAVQEGRCDIGLSSRNLKDEETANPKAEVVAIDGIAVIVNTSNTVTDLTVDEIAQIYTGEITNWN